MPAPPPTDPAGRWALRAARGFDGRAAHPGPVLVVVEDDRIAAVDTSGAHPPTDLPVVDAGDAAVLPGLVDAHVHLAFDPDENAAALADAPVDLLRARMTRNAARQLAAGVTTVRDLGDRDYLAVALRDAPRHPAAPVPRILAAGPPLTRVGGHCWFLGGEAEGEAALRAAVAERAARGVDIIKVMATGGAITPGFRTHESQYDAAALAAVVDEAARHGLAVTAHAHGPAGIADALAAGVAGLEHASFFTADGVAVDWPTVEAIAAAGVYVGATEAMLPEGSIRNPAVFAKLAERGRNFVRMHAAGVALVCCSDSGVVPRKPHGVLPYGVAHFGRLGLPATEALAAATSVAAEACGLAGEVGRLAPGFTADLLVVGGDPVADLECLRDVRAVYRAGRRVASAAIGGPPG